VCTTKIHCPEDSVSAQATAGAVRSHSTCLSSRYSNAVYSSSETLVVRLEPVICLLFEYRILFSDHLVPFFMPPQTHMLATPQPIGVHMISALLAGPARTLAATCYSSRSVDNCHSHCHRFEVFSSAHHSVIDSQRSIRWICAASCRWNLNSQLRSQHWIQPSHHIFEPFEHRRGWPCFSIRLSQCHCVHKLCRFSL